MRLAWLAATSALLLSAPPALAAGSPACASSAADADDAMRTVRALFVALAHDDAASARALLAPDFYAYDAGKRFDGPGLIEAVRKAHAEGVMLQWGIGAIDTHLGCDMAWTAWENRGSAGKPPAVQPVVWLESAVLQRHGDGWVIAFLHSNRVDRTK